MTLDTTSHSRFSHPIHGGSLFTKLYPPQHKPLAEEDTVKGFANFRWARGLQGVKEQEVNYGE